MTEEPSKAFVMMPFARGFDDVYDTVRQAAKAANPKLKIVRMDEIREAGSITDDMVREIREASLCIADVTGANPNVMWETGFASALGTPIVLLHQDGEALPFDIHHVRAIKYDRGALSATLRMPLQAAVKATLERVIPKPGIPSTTGVV